MEKLFKFIVALLFLFIGYMLGIYLSPRDISTSKIDTIERKVEVVKFKGDSIQKVIDTVYVQIKENEKRYEETSNIIINNSPDDNYLFFAEYIEQNKERFDSINNI